jgi:prepilin-type N-terminal cleavage/methylation domain-containing protein
MRLDDSREETVSARGFTLIELLVACALLLLVTGAVTAMAVPLRESFERSAGAADLTGGSRMVVDRLADEVREAGSGASITGARFADYLAPLVPQADLDTAAWAEPAHALRVTRIAALAAQGVLSTDAPPGSVGVGVGLTDRCNSVGLACGFRAGMTALLFDRLHSQPVLISAVGAAGSVTLVSPLASAFSAGSVLVATTITAFGLRADPDGAFRLVRSTGGAEQPMLDHVVAFDVTVRGADPLHPHAVDLVLRVEAPSAAMRGPAGRFFVRPGTARRPSLWVPDVEIRATIALRNGAG